VNLRRTPLWTLGLGAGTLVLVVALGVGLLVFGALRAANAQRELAHGALADRAFDAMEAELSALVAREEDRSFLQYRARYTPEGLLEGADALARSPLADPPEDPAVIGYFQIDPDGVISTPMAPDPDQAGSAAADPERVRTTLALAGLVRDIAPVAPESAPVSKEEVASNSYTVAQSLNRGSQMRQNRVEKKQKYVSKDVENFQVSWLPDPLSRPTQAAEQPSTTRPTRAHAIGADAVVSSGDATVSPLQGAPVDAGHLVLYRDVLVAGQRYRQGLALDVSKTLASLGEHALRGSLLEQLAVLRGPGDTQPSVEDYPRVYAHTFDAPFAGMTASLWMKPVPDQGGSVAWILGLSLALGLVGLVGLAAVGGQVLATVRFAERRSNFVAAVSHELKTPLTAIRMYAEMLRDDLVESDEKRHGYYEIITSESERLTRLIQNVLELAKLERGTRSLRPEVGDPAAVLSEVARTLGPHAAERGFNLEVAVSGPLPAARFDRDALTQVLVNLVDNAIKFSSDAQDRWIVLEAEAAEDGVCLRVRDHGPGVPARHLRRIFEPFYRGERELTRRTQGTGIGLALVDGLVRGMGGRVSAWNAREGGLVVELHLALG